LAQLPLWSWQRCWFPTLRQFLGNFGTLGSNHGPDFEVHGPYDFHFTAELQFDLGVREACADGQSTVLSGKLQSAAAQPFAVLYKE
jgi:hypothetical protein